MQSKTEIHLTLLDQLASEIPWDTRQQIIFELDVFEQEGVTRPGPLYDYAKKFYQHIHQEKGLDASYISRLGMSCHKLNSIEAMGLHEMRRFIVPSADRSFCFVDAETPEAAANKLAGWMKENGHIAISRFQTEILSGQVIVHELPDPSPESGLGLSESEADVTPHTIRLEGLTDLRRIAEGQDGPSGP
jgi:hypothetical protein